MALPCAATLLLLALVATGQAAVSAGAASADGDRLRPTLDALLDQAVQHGFPEGRGASAWQGTLTVTFQGSAAGFAGLRPRLGHLFRSVSADRDQAEASGEVTGVHLRLADGAWLAKCELPVPVAEGLTVACDGARAVPLALVFARESGERTNRRAALPPSLVQRLDPADAAAADRLARFYPLLSQVPPLGTLLLWRAGHPAGDDLLRVLAVGSAVGSPPAKALDAPLEIDPRSWRHHHLDTDDERPLALPDPATVVRRLLRRWAITRLIQADDAHRPAALAAARALAGGDPAEVANLLRIAAGRALPARPAAEAALSVRLAAWRPDQERASASDPLGLAAGDDEEAGESLRRGRGRRPMLVHERDAGALVRLLDDGRPSRWVDQGVARTLGDCALAALARLIGNDPRDLAGISVGPRWDAVERKACADALAGWWSGQGASVSGVLADAVDRLPLEHALNLVQQRGGERQRHLGATLGRRLAARPPSPAELDGRLEDLASVALELPEVGELRRGLDRLPATPATTVFLAAWQARCGDDGALTALIDAGLAGTGDTGTALLACALRPQPQRLAAALALLAGDPAHGSFLAAAAVALGSWRRGDQERALRRLLQALPGQVQRDASQALRLALARRLLADQRPLPPGLVQVVEDRLRITLGADEVMSLPEGDWRQDAAGKDGGSAPAADLRWCDLAALGLVAHLGELDGAFDATAPLEERDRDLKDLRATLDALTATALAEAGLGDPAAVAGEALY